MLSEVRATIEPLLDPVIVAWKVAAQSFNCGCSEPGAGVPIALMVIAKQVTTKRQGPSSPRVVVRRLCQKRDYCDTLWGTSTGPALVRLIW